MFEVYIKAPQDGEVDHMDLPIWEAQQKAFLDLAVSKIVIGAGEHGTDGRASYQTLGDAALNATMSFAQAGPFVASFADSITAAARADSRHSISTQYELDPQTAVEVFYSGDSSIPGRRSIRVEVTEYGGDKVPQRVRWYRATDGEEPKAGAHDYYEDTSTKQRGPGAFVQLGAPPGDRAELPERTEDAPDHTFTQRRLHAVYGYLRRCGAQNLVREGSRT